jgi:hypothetical protein
LEILNLFFRPKNLAALGLKYQNWNSIHRVSLWSQANIIAKEFRHQLCSHTTKDIDGQQRSWISLSSCKAINSGNPIRVQDIFLSSKGIMFWQADDQRVEDAILPLFGLCHQRWMTTPLSLIPDSTVGTY